MNFYKNVIEHKGKLLIRGVLNGKDYKDKAEFDADVADPNTDTTAADFQQDLIITPASIGGKSDTK